MRSLAFSLFFKHYTSWPWGEFSGTSTPRKEWQLSCFPPVNNPSHCTMMNFRLFGNDLLAFHRLMSSNNYFFKITADVFPPWHCGNTHLIAQQSAKTSALIEVLTPPSAGCCLPSSPYCFPIPVEAGRVNSVFRHC